MQHSWYSSGVKASSCLKKFINLQVNSSSVEWTSAMGLYGYSCSESCTTVKRSSVSVTIDSPRSRSALNRLGHVYFMMVTVCSALSHIRHHLEIEWHKCYRNFSHEVFSCRLVLRPASTTDFEVILTSLVKFRAFTLLGFDAPEYSAVELFPSLDSQSHSAVLESHLGVPGWLGSSCKMVPWRDEIVC